MPPPLFHFAIGAFVGFIVILFFIPFKKKWLIYLPFIITLFGFLAMMPDIPKWANGKPLIGRTFLASHNLTVVLMQEKFNTLFFYHPYLDHNKARYESSADLSIFGFFSIITLYSLTSLGYIIYVKKYLKNKND